MARQTMRVERSGQAEVHRLGFEFRARKRIRGAIDISRPVFGINQHAIAALTVPFIERLDRPQSPGVPDVAEHVREIASRISGLMCFSGHNTLP